MKALLLRFAMMVATGLCSVSCHSGKSVGPRIAGPAYELGSHEFAEHTPPQFHQLKLRLNEAAVLEAVGKPNNVGSLLPLDLRKPVGKRYTYSLNEQGGIVWVDFDTNMLVTGIFWRDRD